MIFKRKYMWAIAALLLAGSCTHNHEGEEHHHEAEEAEHGGESEEITLSSERAEQLGVVVTEAVIAPISNVITVTGEVLPDPSDRGVVTAPASGSVTLSQSLKSGAKVTKGSRLATVSSENYAGGDANRAAQIRLEAAKKELDRLTPLRRDGIITQSQYNAALEEYNMAKNAVGSHGTIAVAPISGTITEVLVKNGEYVEAGAPIAAIASGGNMIVRADIPRRYGKEAASSNHATLRLPYSGDTVVVNSASAPAGEAANAAYIPAYFTVTPSADLTPGSFVEVILSSPTSESGVTVPLTAVTERMGKKFVYIRLDEDCYERRPVTLGSSDGIRTLVTEGIQPGEMVVTEGVTYIRLAETSGAVPEGHHHH